MKLNAEFLSEKEISKIKNYCRKNPKETRGLRINALYMYLQYIPRSIQITKYYRYRGKRYICSYGYNLDVITIRNAVKNFNKEFDLGKDKTNKGEM